MIFNNEEDDDFVNPLSASQPSPTSLPAPSDAPQAMNPLVKDYLTKKLGLPDFSPQKRQELVADSAPNFGDKALAALSALGAGFQGQNAAAAGLNRLNSIKADKEKKVSDFDAGHVQAEQAEADDPNSPASQRFKATLKANFPDIVKKYGDSFDNLTAADQKSVFQVAETKSKLDSASAQRAAVQEAKSEADADRKAKNISDQDNKDALKLGEHLNKGWTGRSGQAGVVQGKINAAEAAQALLEQAKTQPGGLDSRQIEELSQSSARLLGGGTAASGRVEALVPHTFWGNAQSIKEYLTNHPTGSGLEEFTNRMADTIQREKDLANKQKLQFQIQGLAPFSRLKKSNPEVFGQILSSQGIDPSMIDEKGQYLQKKQVAKTQTNQKTGEKRVIYTDGSSEIIGPDGKGE